MPLTTRPHGSNFKPKWDIFSIEAGKEKGWEKAREGACARGWRVWHFFGNGLVIASRPSSKASLYGQIYLRRRQSNQRRDDSVHCRVSHRLLRGGQGRVRVCVGRGGMKYLSGKTSCWERS